MSLFLILSLLFSLISDSYAINSVQNYDKIENIPITDENYKTFVFLDRYGIFNDFYEHFENVDISKENIKLSDFIYIFNKLMNSSIEITDFESFLTVNQLVDFIYSFIEGKSLYNIRLVEEFYNINEKKEILSKIGVLKNVKDSGDDCYVSIQSALESTIASVVLNGNDMISDLQYTNTEDNLDKIEKNIIIENNVENLSLEENSITINELCNLFNKVLTKKITNGYEEYTQIATNENVLAILYGNFQEYSIISIDRNFEYVYILGDSSILSGEDFEYFMDNKHEAIDKKVLENILSRIKEFRKTFVLDGVYTKESFESFVDNMTPEYKDFITECDSGFTFWLSKLLPINTAFIKKSNDIGVILHELQHEWSARLSSIFKQRRFLTDKLMVDYLYKPNIFYWYDPLSDLWVSCDTTSTLEKSSSFIISDFVPENIKDIDLYEMYTSREMASNNWGLPGILMEFSSCLIESDVMNTCYCLDGYNKVFSNGNVAKNNLFWMSFTGSYIAGLKELYSEEYDKLLSNNILINLIGDLYRVGYLELSQVSQIDMSNYADYLAWFMDDNIQECIMDIFTKSKISEVDINKDEEIRI